MRKPICYENALGVADHFLLEGSVKWEDGKKIPLVWNFGYDVNSLLGHAQDLQREEDGAITAELNINDLSVADLFKEDLIAATFQGSEVQEELCDGIRVFHNVLVRTVSLVSLPQVPW